jgi:hypothetical protein
MAKHTISFSVDAEADKDIIEWLNRHRNRSQAIRDALRQAIAPSRPDSGLPPIWGLSDLRQVFEAVLDERLSGVRLEGTQSGNAQSEHGREDPQLAARLDALEF